MTDKQFEEFFRNKLQDHPSEVPEEMWQRIISAKKKDRKIIFFWKWYVLGGFLLISFITGGYFVLSTNRISEKPKMISTVKGFVSNERINSNKEKKKINFKGLDSAKQENSKPILIPPLTEVKTSPEENTIALQPAGQNRKSGGSFKDGGWSISHRDYISTEQNLSNADTQNKPEIASSDESHAFQSQDKQEKSGIKDKKNNPGMEMTPDATDKKQPVGNSLLPGDTAVKKSENRTRDTSKMQTPKPLFKKETWFLEAYGSPDFPFNNNSPATTNSYFKPELSYTIGLRLGKSFGKHFTAQIGIQFSRINELSEIPDSGFFDKHLHYKSLDLPLLAGYEIKKQHVKLTINAGLVLNLYSWVYMGSDRLDPNFYFRTYSGLSLYLGMHYVRPVNERLLFFAEPYYRYRLSDMVVSGTGYTQKINILGLSVGTRYQFVKRKKAK